MIINIRGTHGSGKSTLVRQLIERYEGKHLVGKSPKKPNGYLLVTFAGPVYVVGSYETACGGCDGIQPYDTIWPRVLEYHQWGHVIFEGALISSSYGNIGRASEALGDQMVFAFLDTPLQVCLDRIKARRAARGNTKPLDPKNTANKFKNCNDSITKIRDEFKRRVVVLDYRKPMPQLLALLANHVSH